MRIICDLTDLKRQEAEELLQRSGQKVKLALLMHWTGLEAEEGTKLLEQHHGNLRAALRQ